MEAILDARFRVEETEMKKEEAKAKLDQKMREHGT
jgi:hypothetical protein